MSPGSAGRRGELVRGLQGGGACESGVCGEEEPVSQGSVGRQLVGVHRASEPFMRLEAERPRDLRPGGQRAVAPFSLSPEVQESEEKEAGDREARVTGGQGGGGQATGEQEAGRAGQVR